MCYTPCLWLSLSQKAENVAMHDAMKMNCVLSILKERLS